MEENKLILFSLLIFMNITSYTRGFNLDTKVPIVKEGSVDSYFGYSVAQHQIYQQNAGRSDHVLLVGAPLDNNTNPLAPEVVRKLNKPGVVYQCPFTPATDDCTPVDIDNQPPLGDDIKEGQWLGVSVASQGTTDGKAVACAHRYTRGDDSFRQGIGACYSMTNTLDEDMYLSRCGGFPNEKNHVDYGMCQLGTSASLDPESNDVLLGAPGSRSWRGAVFKHTIEQGLNVDNKWYWSPADPVDEDNPGPAPAVRYYSYLGMSSKIGRVIGGQKTFITGAPRAKDFGQVLLLVQGTDALTVTEDHYLSGEQFGSWFGCAVETVDLNKDDRDDIVVGAPFYSEKGVGGAIYIYMNGPKGITSETDPIKITSRKMTPAECKEMNCENARFGYSIAALGDLDLDGYNDIAVGAPFEKNGAVYIFRGGPDGPSTTPSQRIAADDLQSARPLTTFGYALAGGNDMDSNGYPDLVVGSFDSHKALVLRARPVINLQSIMVSIPNKINTKVVQCHKDSKRNNCFEIQVCFSFTAEPKEEFSGQLPITYTLEAERYTGRVKSRVFFKGTANQDDTIERDLNIAPQSTRTLTCDRPLVYIVDNNKDFLNPIPFRLTYKLKGIETPTMNPGDRLPPKFNTYPVLNEKQAQEEILVPFENNCGSDEKCVSDLKVFASFPDLLSVDDDDIPILKVGEGQNTNNELRLLVTVTNYGEDAHEATTYITLPDTLKYIGTDKTGGSDYSCSLLPSGMLVCNIGNPLDAGKPARVKIRLNTKDLSPTTPKLTIGINATTTSEDSDSRNNVLDLVLRVVVETDLVLDKSSDPLEVFYGGVVRGESAMKYEDDIGFQVIHSYVITNEGRGRVENTTVIIHWPYEVANKDYAQGKHLLYLMEEPMMDPAGKCKTPSYGINPLKIEEDSALKLRNSRRRRPPITEVEPNVTLANSQDGGKRRKRATVVKPENIRDSSGNVIKAVVLDCDKGTAKCFKIECTIKDLYSEESVVIKLRARLWNSTFLEDYKNVDSVYVYSKAEIRIDPALNIKEVSTANNVAKALTIAIPDIQVQDRPGIPNWAIIVAAIAGLLLLILLIIILWKCGFFQRRRHPDDVKTHKGQLKKQNYDDEYYN